MRRYSIELSLTTAFIVLLTSRSILLPPALSQLAPLIAAILVLAGMLFHTKSFRIPTAAFWLFIMIAAYAMSSAASGSMENFTKSLSIGLMWMMAVIIGANMQSGEKTKFLGIVLIAAILEALLAAGETLVGSADIRSLIAAAQDGQYLVRPNTILGSWTNRAQGTIGYPIPLAHFLTLSVALALFVPTRISALKRLLLVLILFVGILLTGTRSASPLH